VEVGPRGPVDRVRMIIMEIVGAKIPPNRRNRKGSRLKFLHQFIFCPVPDTSGLVEHSCRSVALSDKFVEYRNGEKQTKLLGGGVFRFCVSLCP